MVRVVAATHVVGWVRPHEAHEDVFAARTPRALTNGHRPHAPNLRDGLECHTLLVAEPPVRHEDLCRGHTRSEWCTVGCIRRWQQRLGEYLAVDDTTQRERLEHGFEPVVHQLAFLAGVLGEHFGLETLRPSDMRCHTTAQLACAPVVMPYADFVQRIVLVVATVDVNAAWVQHAVGRKDKEDLDGSIAAIRDVTIEHVLIARSVRTHSRGCTRDTIVQVRTRTVSLGRPYFLKMWRTSCQRSRRNCEHAPFGTWDTSHRQHTSNCPWVSPTRMHLVPAGTGTAMQLPAGV